MRSIHVRRPAPVARLARRPAVPAVDRELVGAALVAQDALSALAMAFCERLVRSGVLKAPARL